jgi:glycosyltransferase involved in cell wall biosynthesis
MPTPAKVLITGGREIGGIASLAEGLAQGFRTLGIPSEVIPPSRILSRWRDLRAPHVLKILSTEAVFAAPFARRAICIAHGVPRGDYQGWRKLLAIIGSFKLANACAGVQLVSVSHYTAATLRAIFNVRTDAVVHNPVKPLYLEADEEGPRERRYVTYVGRLVAAKNLHRILPAVRDLLDETPGLRACIIGDGEQRPLLEAMVGGDSRFEFRGKPDDLSVRECLRRTKVFVSGNEVEGFGISYLEALTQGCNVAMPACGGGLEISLDSVGKSVHLLPLSFDRVEVLSILRRSLTSRCAQIPATAYSAKEVAKAYLQVDSHFSPRGRAPAGCPSRGRADVDKTTALAQPGKES